MFSWILSQGFRYQFQDNPILIVRSIRVQMPAAITRAFFSLTAKTGSEFDDFAIYATIKTPKKDPALVGQAESIPVQLEVSASMKLNNHVRLSM